VNGLDSGHLPCRSRSASPWSRVARAGAGWVRPSAFVAGIPLGALVLWLGGLGGFLVLLAFFLLGTGLTRLGYSVKAARGVAEAAGGRRGRRTSSPTAPRTRDSSSTRFGKGLSRSCGQRSGSLRPPLPIPPVPRWTALRTADRISPHARPVLIGTEGSLAEGLCISERLLSWPRGASCATARSRRRDRSDCWWFSWQRRREPADRRPPAPAPRRPQLANTVVGAVLAACSAISEADGVLSPDCLEGKLPHGRYTPVDIEGAPHESIAPHRTRQAKVASSALVTSDCRWPWSSPPAFT
jgi:hypothetical protein